MRKDIRPIQELPTGLKISDSITLRFEDGDTIEKIYAGSLEGHLNGKRVMREFLFVDSPSEIESCRSTRRYLKVSSGFTPSHPGRKIKEYEIDKKG
jgi:hypothetical protein